MEPEKKLVFMVGIIEDFQPGATPQTLDWSLFVIDSNTTSAWIVHLQQLF